MKLIPLKRKLKKSNCNQDIVEMINNLKKKKLQKVDNQ